MIQSHLAVYVGASVWRRGRVVLLIVCVLLSLGSRGGCDKDAAFMAVADRATAAEDTPVTIAILANDQPGGSTDVAVEIDTPARHGTVTPNPDGTVTYVPAADFHGTDSFTYTSRDSTALVTVTVTPVNDPPMVATPIAAVRVPVGTASTDLELRETFADVDAETTADTLTLTVVANTQPDLVTATLEGTTGHLAFAPDQRGVAILTVRATDRAGEAVETAVEVLVFVPLPVAALYPHPKLLVGNAPIEVVVADFNADGRPDLVTANFESDDLALLFGRGDGTFEPPQRLAVGDGPVAVAVADLNADGRPDLVTANRESDDLALLFGRGDGTFEPPQRLAVECAPGAVAVADLNVDGVPDLVIAHSGFDCNSRSANLLVLLGQGAGTFQAPQRVGIGRVGGQLAVADVNADGVPDLVALQSELLSVLLGQGDGTFQVSETLFAGDPEDDSFISLVVTDVNADGVPDLLTGIHDSFGAQTYLTEVQFGQGDGTFPTWQPFPLEDPPFRPTVVATADLNGDGIADWVLGQFGTDPLVLLVDCDEPVAFSGASLFCQQEHDWEGSGNSSVEAAQRVAAGGPDPVAVADLNADGRLDLVSVGAGQVAVLLGQRDGTLRGPQTPPEIAGRAAVIAVADLNADGTADLLIADTEAPGPVTVFLGQDDDTFQPLPPVTEGRMATVAVADVNADGHPDLAMADADTGVSIWLGQGDGTFAAPQPVATAEGATWVAIAEVNGDGVPDLVTTHQLRDEVGILVGQGDGTFAAPQPFATSLPPHEVLVVDLNADGAPDLVTFSEDAPGLAVLVGQGDGTFAASQPVGTGAPPPSAVAVADVNADGAPDVIIAKKDIVSVFGIDLGVRLGRGDGTFGATQPVPVGRGVTQVRGPVRAVAVADCNTDGHLDLVAAMAHADDVAVLLGHGDGSFQAPQFFAAGALPAAVVVTDITADGLPDLVVAGAAGVALLRHR